MRTVLVCCLLATIGCQTKATQDAAHLVTALMDVWQTGDTSSLPGIVSESAVYDDVPNGEMFEGVDGFAAYVGHVHNWASDVELRVDRVGGNANRAYAEWTMTGVQSSPIRGRIPVATNKPFTLRGLTVVEVADGRITRAADYLDVLGFVVQIGARVELPGGVVIQLPEQGE